MIFSILEKVNEHERVQKVMVKGGSEEVAVELENIMKEMIKHGFSEDLIMSVMYNVLNDTGCLARR